MALIKCHRVRLFTPDCLYSINCMSLSINEKRLAILRRSLNQQYSASLIEIWNISSGSCAFIERTLQDDEDEPALFESILWIDEYRILVSGLRGIVQEIDLITNKFQKQYFLTCGPAYSMSINHKKSLLAIAGEEGISVLKILGNPNDIILKNTIRCGRTLSVCWSCKKDRVLIAGSVSSIKLWHYKKGLCLLNFNLSENVIVWSLIQLPTSIFEGNILVSGDSEGKTRFWNLETQTLTNTISSHEADVLAIAFNEANGYIYSTGIDPLIVVMSVNKNGRGIPVVNIHGHSHDARALIANKDYLFSGGVDCYLSRNIGKADYKIKYAPNFSSKVHIYNNTLMFQYLKYLEIWKLGSTKSNLVKEGDILTLDEAPVKLAKVLSKKVIRRSAFRLPWIAYCVSDSFIVLKLNDKGLTKKEVLAEPLLDRIDDMSFINNNLLTIITGNILHIYDVSGNCIVLLRKLEFSSGIHSAVGSNEFLAVCLYNYIELYKLKDWSPKLNFKTSCIATFMQFNVNNDKELLICLSDGSIQKYSITDNTHESIRGFHGFYGLKGVFPFKDGYVAWNENELFYVVNGELKTKCSKYGTIVNLSCEKEELILCEIDQEIIMKNLPGLFRKKIFGT